MIKNKADIYLFNPTCEYAIANGMPSWQANRTLQKMETDLATLPLFFAKPGDYIIVDRLPSEGFINHLQQLGIEIPRFVLKHDVELGNIKCDIGKLCPWGWSPAAHKVLAGLKQKCSEDFKASPVFNWKPEYKNLYSKNFARQIQHKIVENYTSDQFISNNQLTEICAHKNDFQAFIDKWGKLMIKTPWSSSGRGLQPIRNKPIHPKVWAKIMGMVKSQGYVIVEPYLDKVMDLAFQFEIKKGKIKFLGISNFFTDYKGQYIGNSLKGLPDSVNKDVQQFLKSVPNITLQPIIETLENSEMAANYEGYFGVDTLLFRDDEDIFRVNPCLEINMRYNMGLLCLQLEKFVASTKKGIFRTWYQPGVLFKDFKHDMEQKYPLVLKEEKIESGFFALTEANEDTQFGAYLLV